MKYGEIIPGMNPSKLSYGLSFSLNSGYALIITLYPLILIQAGFTPYLIGLIFLSYNLCSAFARFPSGYLILKYGNPWGIKISCGIFLGAGILGILAPILGYAGYLLTASLLGLAAAFYFPAQYALIADISRDILRSYAKLNIVSGIGWILGPLIAGWILHAFSQLEICLIASGFMGVGLGCGMLIRGAPTRETPKISIEKFPYVLTIVFLLSGIATGFSSPSIPVYLSNLGANEAQTGLILALAQAGSYLFQLPGSSLAKHLGTRNLYLICTFSSSPLIGLLGWMDELIWASASYFGYMVLAGMSWVSLDSMVAQKFHVQRALVLGWIWGFWRIGYGMGSWVAGYLWEILGIHLLYPLAGMVIMIGGALIALESNREH